MSLASAQESRLDLAMLIGGRAVTADDRLEVRNPARPANLVGTVPRGAPMHVEAAIAAAKQAQPGWAARSFTERAAALASALECVTVDIEARARTYVQENGKTLAEARAELSDIVPRARHTLALADELDAAAVLPATHGRTVLRSLPHGVVVCIVPWNAPVSLACMQVIPALLAGNAVVLKVPESCPLALTQTALLIARALPSGLLNIVAGLPTDIGEVLTSHPDVAKIAFTGSIPSARRIIGSAAGTIKSLTLELGGNDAAILLDDADLGEETIERMAAVVFRMTGQVCMAIKRVYVPESLHDRFVAAFAAAMDRITVGDGLAPGVTMGPLHTAAARRRATALVEDAERRGGEVHRLGRVHEDALFHEGHFVQPTLVTEIGDDAPLVAEEQFCPVLPVLRYGDVEEAVHRANSTIFGLGGSVWGRDVARSASVAVRLQAGTVFVNTHGTNSVNRRAPYGGVKQSGSGRRAGIEGVREYLQSQTLTTYEY